MFVEHFCIKKKCLVAAVKRKKKTENFCVDFKKGFFLYLVTYREYNNNKKITFNVKISFKNSKRLIIKFPKAKARELQKNTYGYDMAAWVWE